MINAETFIEAARGLGFTHYTGVPCSYLTPFINYVINDDRLSYISSANEGDAVAAAAGLTVGGRRAVAMMQNSGLGNAVNPLTSLANTFDIPVLLIVTHRGKPGRRDEPQHELMGKITGDLFDLMEIPREPFPADERDIGPALERANRYLTERQRPYALLMEQGTVAPHPLEGESIPSRAGIQCLRKSVAEAPAQLNRGQTLPEGGAATPGRLTREQALPESGAAAPGRLTREQALREIIDHTPVDGSILIGTTGYTGRELFAIDDRDNQLYMVGSMGCASSFALGLSLARPDLEVTVVDGDGAGLMRMGNFATIGSYGRGNLAHVLLDNGVHESTGSQATVSANVDFADIAAACGYGMALDGTGVAVIRELYARKDVDGARFAHLRITPGTQADLPRPDTSPADVLRRLMAHINE